MIHGWFGSVVPAMLSLLISSEFESQEQLLVPHLGAPYDPSKLAMFPEQTSNWAGLLHALNPQLLAERTLPNSQIEAHCGSGVPLVTTVPTPSTTPRYAYLIAPIL